MYNVQLYIIETHVDRRFALFVADIRGDTSTLIDKLLDATASGEFNGKKSIYFEVWRAKIRGKGDLEGSIPCILLKADI